MLSHGGSYAAFVMHVLINDDSLAIALLQYGRFIAVWTFSYAFATRQRVTHITGGAIPAHTFYYVYPG